MSGTARSGSAVLSVQAFVLVGACDLSVPAAGRSIPHASTKHARTKPCGAYRTKAKAGKKQFGSAHFLQKCSFVVWDVAGQGGG
eukprot:1280975-Rhodomonas_salina.1